MSERSESGMSPIGILIIIAVVSVIAGAWLFSRPVTLGPVDGHDLPGEDTSRVKIGDPAPNFRLPAFSGETISLSDFRGKKEVVLVFYRGHW